MRIVDTHDVKAWPTFEERFEGEKVARKTFELCIDPVVRT